MTARGRKVKSEQEKLFLKQLGQTIKQIRMERKISQVDFAHFLKMTIMMVCRFESGMSAPDIYTLKTIADALNVTIDDLIPKNN